MSVPPVHRLPAPIEQASARIQQAARAAVERSVESLGLAALSALSAAQRSDLLAAQFELDRKSAVFLLAFNDALQTRLRRECAPRQDFDRSRSDWSELSLMDDTEVERKVQVERLGLQIAHGCEWELRELVGYLSSVLSRERMDGEANPLRPEAVADALMRACEAASERIEVRQALTAELARTLADTMGATYKAIVADMQASGVKPASLAVRMSDSRSGADSRRGPLAGEGRDSGAGGLGRPSRAGAAGGTGATGFGTGASSRGAALAQEPAPRGGVTFGQVPQGMMSVIRRLAVSDPAAFTGAAESWGTADGDGEGPPLMAPNMIRAHRDELRAVARGAIDHMVIDVVGSLFDQILSDPKVPPQVARQIARLQLPVLRVALGDPSFFSSRRHPVRRFINRIASVAAGVDDFDGPRGQQLLARIRALVEEVVEGDFEQVGIYEARLGELEQFVAAQERAAVVNEHGDAAALLQRKEDQLRQQRLYAAQLEGELKSIPAPEFLRQFVAEVWSQCVVRAVDRHGADSDITKRLRRTALELLMSVQAKSSPQQRKTFLAELPNLMRALNEGLDLIAWPDAQRRAFFGQLLPAHAEALKNAIVRPLDYNLLAKQVEGAVEKPLPRIEEVRNRPLTDLPVLSEEILVAPFDAQEAAQVGLVKEASLDWDGHVDIDLGAEPELTSVDIQLDALANEPDAPEPSRGRSLADHVQIGFAYQMHLQGEWQKVRLSHVSAGRTFYVFTYGERHKQTVSLTHRMLVRLCETQRMRAFENAYLIERATARARKQLAALRTPSRAEGAPRSDAVTRSGPLSRSGPPTTH